jgi:hypothetical protein
MDGLSNHERDGLSARESFRVPCHWTDEVSGQLAPAVKTYLKREPLSRERVRLLREYFAQWIQSPVWDMNTHATKQSRVELRWLRESVSKIHSDDDIHRWLEGAAHLGLDPIR